MNINFDKSDNQKSKKLMKENKERLIEEVTADLEYVTSSIKRSLFSFINFLDF